MLPYIIISDNERKLLCQYWEFFYRPLDLGNRSPTTLEQQHFVEVCRGKSDASTTHESAYLKGRMLLERSTLSEDELIQAHFQVEPCDMKEEGNIGGVTSGNTIREINADRWGHRKEYKHRPNW